MAMTTDPTFADFPITDLRRLVETDWARLHDDKLRAKARLRDEFPEYELQVHVLSVGLEIGAASMPAADGGRQSLAIEAGRLAQLLVSRYGLQEQAARWSVAAWGYALGRWSVEAVSSALTAQSTDRWLSELDRQEQAGVTEGPQTVGTGPTVGVDRPSPRAPKVPPQNGPPQAHPYASAALTQQESAVHQTPIPAAAEAVQVAPAVAAGVAAQPVIPATPPVDMPVAPPPPKPSGHRKLFTRIGIGFLVLLLAFIGLGILGELVGTGVQPIWTASVGSPNSGVVTTGNMAFVGTGSNVKALLLSNGHVQWTQPDPDGQPPFVTAGPNALYVANGNRLYSMNPSNGAVGWRFKAHGMQSVSLAPPVYGSGLVMSPANANNRLYIVRSSDGAYVTYIYQSLLELLFYEPAVAGQTVLIPEHYTAGAGGQYVASWPVNAFGNSKVSANWDTHIGSDKPFAPPAAAGGNGALYGVNGGTGTLYKLDPAKGTIVWQTQVAGGMTTATAAGGSVFVAAGGTVYSRSVQDGSSLWKFNTKGSVNAPPVVYQGVVYVGTTNGTLDAINASTGKSIWSYKTGGSIRGPAAVLEDTVLVAATNGKVYAFKVAKA